MIATILAGIDDIKSPERKGRGGVEGTIDLGLPSTSVGLDADLSGSGKGKGDINIPSAR